MVNCSATSPLEPPKEERVDHLVDCVPEENCLPQPVRVPGLFLADWRGPLKEAKNSEKLDAGECHAGEAIKPAWATFSDNCSPCFAKGQMFFTCIRERFSRVCPDLSDGIDGPCRAGLSHVMSIYPGVTDEMSETT